MVTLREPASRAFSSYLYLQKHGLAAPTFVETAEQVPTLLGEGRYATHLRRYLHRFRPEIAAHCAVRRPESYPQGFLDDVTDWLGGRPPCRQPAAELEARLPASSARWLPLAAIAGRAANWVRRHDGADLVGRVKRSSWCSACFTSRSVTPGPRCHQKTSRMSASGSTRRSPRRRGTRHRATEAVGLGMSVWYAYRRVDRTATVPRGFAPRARREARLSVLSHRSSPGRGQPGALTDKERTALPVCVRITEFLSPGCRAAAPAGSAKCCRPAAGGLCQRADESQPPARPLTWRPQRRGRPTGIQYICADNEERWATAFNDTLRLRYHLIAELRRNHAPYDLARMVKYSTDFTIGRLRGRRALIDDPCSTLSASVVAQADGCHVVVSVRHPLSFVGSWRRLGWKAQSARPARPAAADARPARPLRGRVCGRWPIRTTRSPRPRCSGGSPMPRSVTWTSSSQGCCT